MRKGHASRTAMLVAFWRAAADLGLTRVPGFSDPVARYMLDGVVFQLALTRAARLAAQPRGDTQAAALPYLDMIALRVAFIDAVIAERRPTQVVILGAGLDTRCFRLAALRSAQVYELDHPDTQAYKRERVARLGPPLTRPRFVPIDFTRDDLGQVLAAAGFQTAEPTLWIWEGVIMYLDDRALRHTLREIRRLSAPQSTLLAHYHEAPGSDPFSVLRRVVLAWLREPQIGLRDRATMRRELEAAGLQLEQDAGLPEQAARVHAPVPDNPNVQISRIVVARA